MLRWWNSYAFFVNYANIDQFRPRGDAHTSPNILDQWVMSRLHSLIANTETEMAAYRLYNVVPQLLQFIEELTNTYIRFNRSHFWQEGMPEDKRLAYETLYEVLHTLARVMAPFAPFLAEATYQNLARVHAEPKQSVHLETFPVADRARIKPEFDEAVRAMDALVALGRNHREKIAVRAKIPLKQMKIIHRDPRVLDNLKKFEPYFRDELNMQTIVYDLNEDHYIQITAKANFPALGKRLGPKMKSVAGAIQKLPLETLLKLERGETVLLEGEAIGLAEVEIRRAPKGDNPNLSTHQFVSIEVDPTVTPEQIREGLAREIVRKVQATRKAADFQLDDRIELEIYCEGALHEAADAFRAMIASETLTARLTLAVSAEAVQGAHVGDADIDGQNVRIGVRALPRTAK